MNRVNFFVRSLTRCLLLLSTLFVAQAFAAEQNCDDQYCEGPRGGTPISYFTVYVPDDGNPYWDGNVTSHLVETTQTLVSLMSETQSGDTCFNGIEGYDFCYDLSSDPEYNLILGCNQGDEYLYCQLASTSDLSTLPPNAYSIDCYSYSEGQNGESGKQCTITSNPAAIIEQLPIEPDSNWGSIAGGFLSCLNGSFGGAEAMCSQLVSALQDGNIEYATQLVKALAPINPETANNLARDSIRNGNNVVSSRMAQLRSGNPQASVNKNQLFFANNQWLEAGTQLAANDSLASDATPASVSTNISDFGKLGVFINLNVTDGKYKDGSLASSSDFSSQMFTIGVDYRVRNDMVTGLAFNLGQSKTKYKSDVNGELTADSYSFIIYNSFYKNNWYLDTSLTFGGDTYNQERDPTVIANSFEAEYHSAQYSLALATGYDFNINAFSIAPFAQVTVGKVDVDGYTEKAKNAFGPGVALTMDDQSNDIGMLNIGTHFRYVFTTSRGVFIPVITLSAINDFRNDAQVVTGRFVGVAGSDSAFSIRSEETDANYFVVGAGFSFQLKNGNSGFINIESLQGYENLDQNRLTFGWRWEI